MEISVIVPAFRAEDTIGACLRALFAAGFAAGEITVVDDGSPDGTVAAAREAGVEPLVPGGNRGAAQARNAGVAASTGGILFFVDADVMVHEDVRARLEAFFADHPDHAGIFGSYDDRPPAPPRVSRIRNLLHHHVHQLSPGPATTFWTGCGALRRADFEAAGGFRTEDEMIEDVALGLRLARLGRPVVLDPRLQCTHLKEWTWRGFAQTDYRHRAMPWTRMLRDPANRDLAGVLNVGPRGKAAVVAVALSLCRAAADAGLARGGIGAARGGARGARGFRAAVPRARGASQRRRRRHRGACRPLGALLGRRRGLRPGTPLGLIPPAGSRRYAAPSRDLPVLLADPARAVGRLGCRAGLRRQRLFLSTTTDGYKTSRAARPAQSERDGTVARARWRRTRCRGRR